MKVWPIDPLDVTILTVPTNHLILISIIQKEKHSRIQK